MKLKLQKPLKIWQINQQFGANATPFYKEMGMLGHNGIDFYALDGHEVYATHDGRVTFTGYDGSGGLGVVIRTLEKFDYYNFETGKFEPSYFKTIYWHLKTGSIKVTGGQNVKAGDLIAFADNTGKSTGAHLHFGLKPIYKGENDWTWYNLKPENGFKGAINPMSYFTGDYAKEQLYITLRIGDKGGEVSKLQRMLGDVKVDGDFGLQTLGSVKRFQELKEILVDGIVGPKTRDLLNKL